jgi:hypothetical protein
MKKVGIFIAVIMLASVAGMIITCNQIANSVEENSKKFPITYTKEAAPIYLALFGEKESIHDAETTTVKGRNPISDFAYGDDYFIEISKLNCPANGPLDSLISISFKETEMSLNVDYTSPFSRLPVVSSYARQNQESSRHLYVTVFGDGVSQVSKNDSTIVYQGKLKNLGLRYFLNGPQDIYMRQEQEPYERVRVIFARRKNSTYLVLMARKDEAEKNQIAFNDQIFN